MGDSLTDMILADLVEWPSEVVEPWLTNIAVGYGWPPSSNSRWQEALKGRSLQEWKAQVKWSKEERRFEISDFEPMTQLLVRGIIECHVVGRKNHFSSVYKSEERFMRCLGYLYEHGTFPAPLIVLRAPDGFEVIDGSHRMAAMAWYQALMRQERLNEAAAQISSHHRYWIGDAPNDWLRDPATKDPALTWYLMNFPYADRGFEGSVS